MTSSSQLSSLIQSKATQDGDYNTALNNLNLILNNAETVFGNANTCNASYHRDVTTGYPYMANTVKNIDGTNNSSEIMSNPQGLPQYIPVNKVWVGQHIASSTDIINRLNALNASVPNLSTTQIQTYETSVNGFTPDSTSTVSEIQGSLINWLNGVAGSYSTASCPIATSTAWQ
jgi:hypothetical protein